MTIARLVQDAKHFARDKKRLKKITDAINRGFERRQHLYPSIQGFDEDWATDYPELRILEENYPIIREECEKLLVVRHKLTDVEALGGGYTKGGIHSARWKSFMFKSGDFIDQNCKLAPGSAALLRRIPNLYTAFFSILEPHQYITPHWGYWKGFVRFHLGVVIPNDNADQSCWLRVNCKPEDNAKRDTKLVEAGEKYYWKNGKGVIFDDTFLHDAQNGSDQTRVVLWLDLARRMPTHLHVLNTLLLKIAHLEPTIAGVRKRAVVNLHD
jgi:ornithine lipid ester-linked acyl 2-hydroxylase